MQAPAPGPALWRAEREGNCAFLFGTMHVGIEQENWRTPLLNQLIEEAEIVLLERGQFARTRLDVLLVTLLAQLAPAIRLRDALPESQWPQLTLLCRELRIDIEKLGSLSPVVVSSILSGLICERAGRRQEFGVDNALFRAAKDRCAPIESAHVWGQVFKRDVLHAMAQDPVVMSFDDLGSQIAKLEVLDDAYHAGDLALFAAQNLFKPGPFFDIFLGQRNKSWADSIERATRKGKRTLAAGGLAHFMGEKSVCDFLAQRGFEITMVQGIPAKGIWPL